MEFKGNISAVSVDFEGNVLITLRARRTAEIIEAIQTIGDKDIRATIKPWKARRSIDSNNYMWALLSELAGVYKTSKDELYVLMLKRYGTSVILPAMSEMEMSALDQVFRLVIDRGLATVVTATGRYVEVHQMQCFKGSSTYDQAEMTRLVDGIVWECRENGIDTMTDEEIKEMNERWGLDFEKHSNRRE